MDIAVNILWIALVLFTVWWVLASVRMRRRASLEDDGTGPTSSVDLAKLAESLQKGMSWRRAVTDLSPILERAIEEAAARQDRHAAGIAHDVIRAALTATRNRAATRATLDDIERKMLSVASETDEVVQRIDGIADALQSDRFAPKRDALRRALSADPALQVSDAYLDLCIEVMRKLWDDGIRFVDLQQELKILQTRKYAEVWFFLNKPLNVPGSVYYDYLADLVSHNTKVFMYVPPGEVETAKKIHEALEDEVEYHAAELFEYPLVGADDLLPANLVVFCPRGERQRVYGVIVGRDGRTLVAYRLPESEHTAEVIARASGIVLEQRRRNEQLPTEKQENEREVTPNHDNEQPRRHPDTEQ